MVIKELLAFVIHRTDINNDVASIQNERVPAALHIYKIVENAEAKTPLVWVPAP